MKRNFIFAATLAVALLVPAWAPLAAALAQDSWKTIETETHRFLEVAPGVYFVTGTGKVFVFSNCLVIVNDSDTIVVDSHVSPRAARALLDSIKQITNKPVRFLINSHFHHDHVHGNQGFPPDVTIVGHESAREKLLNLGRNEITFVRYCGQVRAAVAQVKASLSATTDPGKRKQLESNLSRLSTQLEDLDTLEPRAPELTFENKMVLHRGSRRIELICFGRAHTEGDVLVFLPLEKVVFTGDFLQPMAGYMEDAYIDEWIGALDQFKKLAFDWILSGHGEPFRERKYIDAQQRVLQSLWDQLAVLRKQGVPPEEAVKKVDLSEPLSFYSGPLPGHLQKLDPRIAVRVYERLKELEGR